MKDVTQIIPKGVIKVDHACFQNAPARRDFS